MNEPVKPIADGKGFCMFCQTDEDDCAVLVKATKGPGAICDKCTIASASEVLTLASRVLERAKQATGRMREKMAPLEFVARCFSSCRSQDDLRQAFRSESDSSALDRHVDAYGGTRENAQAKVRAAYEEVLRAKGWDETAEGNA